MFSLQLHYTQVSFNLESHTFVLETQALDPEGMCKGANERSEIIEAFQDNVDKEARQAGPIYCDTLNGKIIGFPGSVTQLSDLVEFKNKFMARAEMNIMAISVNGKSYAKNFMWPRLEFTKENLDIYEIESEKIIETDREVLERFSKVKRSYQSREELCYIMTTKNEEGMENKPQSSFKTEMCTRLGNWWTVCKFERKIALSLSGLCDILPCRTCQGFIRQIRNVHWNDWVEDII